MANDTALQRTTFHCRKCDAFKVISARGTVVSGPRCPKCHKPMKQVNVVQTELKLFP